MPRIKSDSSIWSTLMFDRTIISFSWSRRADVSDRIFCVLIMSCVKNCISFADLLYGYRDRLTNCFLNIRFLSNSLRWRRPGYFVRGRGCRLDPSDCPSPRIKETENRDRRRPDEEDLTAEEREEVDEDRDPVNLSLALKSWERRERSSSNWIPSETTLSSSSDSGASPSKTTPVFFKIVFVVSSSSSSLPWLVSIGMSVIFDDMVKTMKKRRCFSSFAQRTISC